MHLTQHITNGRTPAMHIVLLALAIVATFTPPANAQRAATAKDAARGSKTARLSADALCAQPLT